VATSARQVRLAEMFQVVLTVTHDPAVQVNLPASLDLGGLFEEIRRTSSRRRNADGSLTREYVLTVLAFEVGDLRFPAIPVTYAAGGSATVVQSQPVPVRVLGVIAPGRAELRDIAPPVPVRTRDWGLIYAAAALLATSLALLLLLWLRRRRAAAVRIQVEEAARQPIALHEQILGRLNELEASGALDAVDRKPAYVRLSEIVRAYLAARYGFPALELTTSEIATHLQQDEMLAAVRELLGDLLERCDLVKYANSDASEDEARQDLYRARRLVERTWRSGDFSVELTPLPGSTGASGEHHTVQE
jgi:hypothetical protein